MILVDKFYQEGCILKGVVGISFLVDKVKVMVSKNTFACRYVKVFIIGVDEAWIKLV